MSPSEVFAKMSEQTCSVILGELFEHEKPLYRSLIENLAAQRKLRPVFIERKARAERFAWIKEALSRARNEPIAANLLQVWLVKRHPAMLCDFLDSLGIAHEENGTVEQIPPQPERAALETATGLLLSKYEPAIVAVYLHAFQALDETGWPLLDAIIAADPRLRLDAAGQG